VLLDPIFYILSNIMHGLRLGSGEARMLKATAGQKLLSHPLATGYLSYTTLELQDGMDTFIYQSMGPDAARQG